jgi:Mrp family chromosome partitioning ATPase
VLVSSLGGGVARSTRTMMLVAAAAADAC